MTAICRDACDTPRGLAHAQLGQQESPGVPWSCTACFGSKIGASAMVVFAVVTAYQTTVYRIGFVLPAMGFFLCAKHGMG